MKKTYSRTFQFGKVQAQGYKSKNNLVELEMELKIEDDKAKFTASGNLWNAGHTDIIEGGQCIDSLYNEYKGQIRNRKTYEAIMALWEKWHLNDINAGCKHQQAKKWGDEKITTCKLKLKWEGVAEKQVDLKKKAMEIILNKGTITLTKEEQELLNLPYWLEEVSIENVSKYPLYKIESQEEKTTGWIDFEKNKKGVLGKPCPVCGYKYGHGWVYNPIERQDLFEITRLLDISPLEQWQIIKLVHPKRKGNI